MTLANGCLAHWPMNDPAGWSAVGLVHHWKLQESAANSSVSDSVSGGIDGDLYAGGAVANTDTVSIAGPIGNAFNLELDNTNYVRMDDGLPLLNASQTIAMWIKPESSDAAAFLFSTTDSTAGELSLVLSAANHLYAVIGTTLQSVGST